MNKTKVRKVKKQLRNLHELCSWREIASKLYDDEIKFGTLQRFAEDPNYIPKDEKLLQTLGLITPPSPYRILPRWFNRTPEALLYFNRKREQIKKITKETRHPEEYKKDERYEVTAKRSYMEKK